MNPRIRAYTTGEVAKLCQVNRQTVCRWFDTGKIRGFRLPPHQDRRIRHDELVRFLKEHGLPLGDLEQSRDEEE
jgi:two-component system response regulator RpaA